MTKSRRNSSSTTETSRSTTKAFALRSLSVGSFAVSFFRLRCRRALEERSGIGNRLARVASKNETGLDRSPLMPSKPTIPPPLPPTPPSLAACAAAPAAPERLPAIARGQETSRALPSENRKPDARPGRGSEGESRCLSDCRLFRRKKMSRAKRSPLFSKLEKVVAVGRAFPLDLCLPPARTSANEGSSSLRSSTRKRLESQRAT